MAAAGAATETPELQQTERQVVAVALLLLALTQHLAPEEMVVLAPRLAFLVLPSLMLAAVVAQVELLAQAVLAVAQQQVRLQLLQRELPTQAAVVAAVVTCREQAPQAAPAS